MTKLKAAGRDLLEQMRAAIAEAYPDHEFKREYDPIVEMGIFAANPDLSAAMRFSANREIAQYIYAKKRSIEGDGDIGGIRVLLVQFSKDQGLLIENGVEVINGESDGSNGRQVRAIDRDQNGSARDVRQAVEGDLGL